MPKLKGQLPISSYPAKGDSEVIPSGLPPYNLPSANVAGVPANHSSTTPTYAKSMAAPVQEYAAQAEGAQWNDDEDGTTAQGYLDFNGDPDPNLSGPHPTQPLHDWHTPKASSWQENDDYLDFTFDTQNVPQTRLWNHGPARMPSDDMDYDDQGNQVGYIKQDYAPYADNLTRAFGGDSTKPQDDFSGTPSFISGIAVYPVVRR